MIGYIKPLMTLLGSAVACARVKQGEPQKFLISFRQGVVELLALRPLQFLLVEQMVVKKRRNGQARNSGPARQATGWHQWTIIVPRLSITGEFVFGRVWRRFDGRRWIYRKHVEYADRVRQDS